MKVYVGPAHITAMDLNAGRFHVKHGELHVPDDLTPGDYAGLAVHGFALKPHVVETKAKAETTK